MLAYAMQSTSNAWHSYVTHTHLRSSFNKHYLVKVSPGQHHRDHKRRTEAAKMWHLRKPFPSPFMIYKLHSPFISCKSEFHKLPSPLTVSSNFVHHCQKRAAPSSNWTLCFFQDGHSGFNLPREKATKDGCWIKGRLTFKILSDLSVILWY